MKGNNVRKVFQNEVGTHCWARNPPTEKRGRIHTSTIAVSVLDPKSFKVENVYIDMRDVIVQYTCSGGKGGQNVNRRSTCVILTHKPTGIIIRSEENRTQGKNQSAGLERLRMMLQNISNDGHNNNLRKSRYNPNDRPIKRRTYRVKDCIVIDHISGKKENLSKILKGHIEILHI